MPSIGEKIREARIQRGLTQTDLSSDIVTPSMISQIEADKARPSYSLVSAIANRLGMPVEYFLNDLDVQFQLSAAMKLAEYHLLIGDPNKAEVILSTSPAPTTPGLIYQDYSMLLARIYRKQNKLQKAIRLLEDLREQALRSQSHRLHFYVCKESGYTECALRNWKGAIYEWEKALQLVDRLANSDSFSTVERDSEIADIYLQMYYVERRLHPEQDARRYLERAREHIHHFGEIPKIASLLADDALKALKVDDAGRARAFSERAVMILTTANMINQYITAGVLLRENDAIDPWGRLAMATASVQPASFLQAEILEIERFLEQGDVSIARKRITRCLEIVEDYRDLLPSSEQEGQSIYLRLRMNEAWLERITGNDSVAKSIMDEITLTLANGSISIDVISLVCARLIQWYAEDLDATSVGDVTKYLERALQKVSKVPRSN